MPTAIYRFGSGGFDTSTAATNLWEITDPQLPPLPHFGLATTNALQAFILDDTNIIDYVQIRGPISLRDLNRELDTDPISMWDTNKDSNGVALDVLNQLTVSRTAQNLPVPGSWRPAPNFPAGTPEVQAAFFREFMDNPNTTNNELVLQAPYTPSRAIYEYRVWQANDPLVHYLASDLNYQDPGVFGLFKSDDTITTKLPISNLNSPGKRYQPWGAVNKQMAGLGNVDTSSYNLYCKDPLVWDADYWDFPTNKYPAVGWIGRVHRGTPWQTIYLKAHNVLKEYIGTTNNPNYIGTNTWAQWTGDTQQTYGQFFDAANSGPLQDRMLFDLFTTSPNENATRGQLSVNVGAGEINNPAAGLAAWSALFSGMVVLTNAATMPTTYISPSPFPTSNSWLVISPAGPNGLYSAVGNLVTNINNMRAGFINEDGVVGTFEHKGDILSVTNLTENSPFLNLSSINQQYYGISDAVYEWLPQQMMSLLTCPTGPRYVVYCYGQTLKPAQDALVTSSQTLAGGASSFGLVTNYQVVAESAARAVIRLDRHASATGTNYTATVESYNPLPPN
jgi:hypothetical protein